MKLEMGSDVVGDVYAELLPVDSGDSDFISVLESEGAPFKSVGIDDSLSRTQIMRSLMHFLVIGFLSILAFSSHGLAEELKNLDMNGVSDLGLQIQSDPKTKIEGTNSIKIITLWPTSICLGEVKDLAIDNAQLIFDAKVKSDLKEGFAFLEMWVQVNGKKYFSRGLNSKIEKTTDWKKLSTLFNLKKGQKSEKITLNLVINGIGTVWIDNVKISKDFKN